MSDNKNLILGSVAIIAVVLAALIMFLPKDGKNEVKTGLDKVKVYIHHDKTEDKEGYYSECKLSTEDLAKVRNAFESIYELSEDTMLRNKQINGDYRVQIDDKFIAFDKEHNNIVYVSKYNALFNYESDFYDLVVKNCSSVES